MSCEKFEEWFKERYNYNPHKEEFYQCWQDARDRTTEELFREVLRRSGIDINAREIPDGRQYMIGDYICGDGGPVCCGQVVNGYNGFYSSWRFDADGNLIEVGSYE